MQTLPQLLPSVDMGTTQQEKVMELSYAQLNLVEEALRQYFGNKASDWVCSTDEQVALSRDEVASFFERVIDQRAAASWSD